MDLLTAGGLLVERFSVPDALITAGMRRMISTQQKKLEALGDEDGPFAEGMPAFPIAEHTDAANTQHYELPPAFFALALGPRRKYSCCLYPSGSETLADAEEIALAETASHAELENGQDVLELGCGWGSLTLWMAEHYPASRIIAVSNSRPQREYIEAEAASRGLTNLTIVTADINDFAIDRRFDRVVSVEMFEHMANWQGLLARVRGWLRPDGKLFIHVFSHDRAPYRFDHRDEKDWIAQHFFTGGIMPSHRLIHHFPELFAVESEWRWNGAHYRKTALDWLANYDAHAREIGAILREVYGRDAGLWRRRWRMFFLATAEMFGFDDGKPWGVSHYLLAPQRA